MKKKYKVLITLAIIAVLGLTGFLVWWLKFRSKSKYLHKRVKEYRPPVKEDVHKKIVQENNNTTEEPNSLVPPKVVYLSYHDIDMIPHKVIEDLKKYCHGYKVEIYRHQSCENFLYKYYGPDVMQLFRELDTSKRSAFWALCRIYVDGGYYLDIRKKFTGHISDIPSSTKTVITGRNIVALSAKPRAPELWNLIMNYFPNTRVSPQEEQLVHYDSPIQVYRNFPLKFTSSVDELVYRHHNLPDVDPKKIDIPVLYINMDKHKERRKFMEGQLEGVTSITRVAGVLVTDKEYQNIPPHSVTKGELGCAMAHRNAWKIFMDRSDWVKVLILEDDACLKLSSRWKDSLSHLHVPAFLGQGATAYILDRPTAEYLLQEFQRNNIDEGVDSWMWKRLYGKDYYTSPENLAYSISTKRTCHTIYYIYAYNAEEKTPTSIADRSYGTNVRKQYCKIANLLIKRSPKVGILSIDPNGNTYTHIQRPRVALIDMEEYVTHNLLNSYDSNYDVHVYTNNTDNVSHKSCKVFAKNLSNFVPADFDTVISSKLGHNSVVLEEPTTNNKYYIDPHGFPVIQRVKVDIAKARSFCEADTPGCSQFEQAGLLDQIFNQIGTHNKYFVEFGSRRPQILNSSYLRMNDGWRGLLLDGEPLGGAANTGEEQPESWSLLHAAEHDAVRLRQAFLTRENINDIFAKHGVPSLFDLLTIDIDRNDYYVFQGLDLNRFSPRVIAIEFSSYFNSEEYCVSKYKPTTSWDGHSVTGSSLGAINSLMRKRGYSYVCHASGEHAIFILDKLLHPLDIGKNIPHVVPEGWQYKIRSIGDPKKEYNMEDFWCDDNLLSYDGGEGGTGLRDVRTRNHMQQSKMDDGKDDWEYLSNRSFSWMRQISVTGLLRHYGIRSVLEIGAYITPVCSIARDNNMSHVLVEPFAKGTSCPNAVMIKAKVSDKDSYERAFLNLPEPRAIVALGINYPSSEDIGYLSNHAQLVVLESPHTYGPGTEDLEKALKACLKVNNKLKVVTDFELNDRTKEDTEGMDKHEHMHTRRIVVLAERKVKPL